MNNENSELKKSERDFEKLVTISLLLGIIIVSGFIVYYVLNPEPGFVTLGMLNSEKKAEDYPTEISLNEDLYFYITIGNYLRKEAIFDVKVLKGDNDTNLSMDNPATDAQIAFTIENVILEHNETWISDQLNISFTQTGSNRILIIELWESLENEDKYWTNTWLRLNITI
jgi:uncharacterized membrane protein